MDLNDSLVADWQFNSLVDSARGKTLANSGNVQLTNGRAVFDGASFLARGGDADFALALTDSFTVAISFRLATTAGIQAIWTKTGANAGEGSTVFYTNGTLFVLTVNDGAHQIVYQAQQAQAGVDYTAIFGYSNSGAFGLRINESPVEVLISATGARQSAGGELRLGKLTDANPFFLAGSIDRVRFWRRYLGLHDQEQVLADDTTQNSAFPRFILFPGLLSGNPRTDTQNSFAQARFKTAASEVRVKIYTDYFRAYTFAAPVVVFVNNSLYQVCTPSSVNQTFVVGLPPGNKIVELVSGYEALAPGGNSGSVGTNLLSATFNGFAVRLPKQPTRFVLYGDSISVGASADVFARDAWAMRLRGRGYKVGVEGISGVFLRYTAMQPGGLNRLADILTRDRAPIVWLAIGSNDYGVSAWTAAEFGAAYRQLLDLIHAKNPDALVFAQSPLLRSDVTGANGNGNTLEDYRLATEAAVRAATQLPGEKWARYVNGAQILTLGDLSPDNLHPSTGGHQKYFEFVRPLLPDPDFDELKITAFTLAELAVSLPKLSADFGDGYKASARTGAQSGVRRWTLETQVVPDLPGYKIGNRTRFDYLWQFYLRHAANEIFVIRDPRTDKLFHASFEQDELSFAAFTALVYGNGSGLVLNQRRARGRAYRAEDGSCADVE